MSAALGRPGHRAFAAWGSTSDPTTWPPRCSGRWPASAAARPAAADGRRALGLRGRRRRRPAPGARAPRGGARPRRARDRQRRPDLALRRARRPPRRRGRRGHRHGRASPAAATPTRRSTAGARCSATAAAASPSGVPGSTPRCGTPTAATARAALLEAAERRFGPLPGLPQAIYAAAAPNRAVASFAADVAAAAAGRGRAARWPSSTTPRRSWRAAPAPPWAGCSRPTSARWCHMPGMCSTTVPC